MAERQLNLFATYVYNQDYFDASPEERRAMRSRIVEEARGLAPASHVYSVFPTRPDADFLIWSASIAEDPALAGDFFTRYAQTVEDWTFADASQTLWGFTRPSMYARGKTEQDIDPFEGDRRRYLVIYPFSKTKEWYLMSMDARQGMMNEHIKLGKTFPDVRQLLLYSFGLQDQEFVVSYEIDDLTRFSELVNGLRDTEARRYTLLDTPIITGVYQSPEAFIR